MRPGRRAVGFCGAILTIWCVVTPSPILTQVTTDQSADAAHVMTTWPTKVQTTWRSFVLNTNFNEHYLKRFLVLHVGDGHAKGEVDAAVRRHAVNDGAA